MPLVLAMRRPRVIQVLQIERCLDGEPFSGFAKNLQFDVAEANRRRSFRARPPDQRRN